MKPIIIREVGMLPRGKGFYSNAEYNCPVCSKVFIARIFDVNSGRKRNCGCVTAFKQEILPAEINGVKVLQDLRTIDGRRNAIFQCTVCPNSFVAVVAEMKAGKCKINCGCVVAANKMKGNPDWVSPNKKEQRKNEHPLYNTWRNMMKRCCILSHPKYNDYGGRGIIVCDSWLNSFETFCNDMGEKPTKLHSIDRIDNNGNYEPSNCRWATQLQQQNNKRNNLICK